MYVICSLPAVCYCEITTVVNFLNIKTSNFRVLCKAKMADVELFNFFVSPVSSKLHNKMLENVLKAPMSFFDTNPKGRVVNRFAKDVDLVDRSIPMTLEALLRLLFQVLSHGKSKFRF